MIKFFFECKSLETVSCKSPPLNFLVNSGGSATSFPSVSGNVDGDERGEVGFSKSLETVRRTTIRNVDSRA
jgi:hypothetical protein